MKHQENKETSAIAFMRSFDETMNLLESIGDQTATEQQSIEKDNESMEDYTNDEGLFNMNSLLDVEVSDTEENQPRMYNTPNEDLTDSDKQLIVEEFADQLSKLHEEVIDFSDIGPIATVIQDKFGFKQNLEDFLSGLMTSAADKQDSQSFAHGKPIPGVAASDRPEDGGPADIAPEQSGPEPTTPELEATPEVDSVPVPVPEVDSAPEALNTEENLVSDAEDIVNIEEADTMEGEPLREPEVDESEAEQVVEDTTGIEIPEADIVTDTEESASGLNSDAIDEVDSNETTEDTDEEDTGEKSDSIEIQLESIKNKLLNDDSEKPSIETQLESIRKNLLESDYPSTQNQDDFEKKASEAEDSAQKGAEDMKEDDENTEVEPQMEAEDSLEELQNAALEVEESTEDDIMPQLEAISAKYHDNENAKIENAKKEEAINTQLEAISSNYHATEKAKLEAEEAEQKLDEKLNTLVESYHKQSKAKEQSNINARKDIKEKISNLNK